MAAGKTFPAIAVVALLTYVPVYAVSWTESHRHADEVLINDVARLNPTYVSKIVRGHEVESLQEALQDARAKGLPVSIAGKRHSMGGHAFYPDAVVLDLTAFDRILAIDVANRTITAQSGATWKDVIERINPEGLAVEVMQAYNAFTIGGSLSVNVHESDPNFGPLVETVRSFRLLLANGTIVDVHRSDELFGLVIGGYGLFGVILDATIDLTEDALLEKDERVIDYAEYLDVFRDVRNGDEVGQVFARLSIARDRSLLRDVVVTTYSVSDKPLDAGHRHLDPPTVALKKFAFGLSRMTDWGKEFRWYLQREHSDLVDAPSISRNNLMNGDLAFLEHTSATDTDILQEYFVPVGNLTPFIDDLRQVVRSKNLNLLSATIRYIPANNESVLSYSRVESFGVVLYFNVGTSKHAQAKVTVWTRGLVDEALGLGGAYYLPYMSYATRDQFRQAYPAADLFAAKKLQHDPGELFRNDFYDTYLDA